MANVPLLATGLLPGAHGEGHQCQAQKRELSDPCLAWVKLGLLPWRWVGVGSEQEASREEGSGTDVVGSAKKKENLTQRKYSWKETKLPQLPLEIALFKMQSADVFR